MKRYFTRRVLFSLAVVLLLIPISAIVGLYVFVNSPGFSERIRTFIVDRIADATGTQVTIENIKWSLREQQLVLDSVTLKTSQDQEEPALLHIQSVAAGIHIRSLLQRRVILSNLTIVNPEFNLRVDADGRTNIPGPVRSKSASPETDFSVSIDDFRIIGGTGVINDQRFSFDSNITNLVSDLHYNSETQVLSAHVDHEGNLNQVASRPISYKMSAEFDFTRGTLVARKIELTSGRSSVSLQGRIDNILTDEINGKLDFSSRMTRAFLSQFAPADFIPGGSTARGTLAFDAKHYSTSGDLTSDDVEVAGWKANSVKAAYAYDSSTKQLSLRRLSADLLGGNATGTILAKPFPGQSRVTVDLDYSNVDSAQLSSVYPWDKKYMIYSYADGNVRGWFNQGLDQYELEINAGLASYPPRPQEGIVALPLTGTLSAALKPGFTEVGNSDLHFFETRVQADGQIAGSDASLKLRLDSANLANLFFLYPESSGKGSFTGTLKGDLGKPTLEGDAVLDDHKYKEWTIRHAEGRVKLDMRSESADLRSVFLTVGNSTASINGTVQLDATAVNLTIRSDRIVPRDFRSITKEDIDGVLSGNVTLTSLKPLKIAGPVRGEGLGVRGHTFETITGNLSYSEPSIEVRDLRTSEGEARLVADLVRLNTASGVISAEGTITSLPLSQTREIGIPQTIGGTIRSARLNLSGTRDKWQISGDADVENLSFLSETFPRARLELKTDWPKLHVNISGTQNLKLQGLIDLEADRYPIEASAEFTDYSLEKLARFSQGTLVASGSARLTGDLTGKSGFSGKGNIRSIAARIKDLEFRNAEPFAFAFDSNRITLEQEATFSGAYGTLINLKGYVGFENSPPLDLDITGNLDLKEFAEASENRTLSVTGNVDLRGHVGGTTGNPTINGTAKISDGSLGREGINTTLSNLNGDLRFTDNRVTFDNLIGQVGGGEVRVRGDGILQNSQLENLNIRIDASRVNLRYPRGMRSTVTGALVLTGSSTAPLLSGNLSVDALSYRSDFETFLRFFQTSGQRNSGTLDNLRFAIHLEGNRNIVVQNELADITGARVDLDVYGTWANPILTGHIEITEGALLVQGKRYDITRGNIDFVDRLKIDPVVDIQAETDVRDYRVILAVSGRTDRIQVEPRSYPPLPQLELITLMGGGKTRDELERSRETSVGSSASAGSASLPTSEQLFQGAAANIFTDLLRTRVGNRLGLMGLDWIQVSPHFETPASNPSLRVTLSQQVSKDLSVTYSQDLTSSQQRLIMVEYFVSKSLSIVASREETNETAALGLDVKLRRRF